MKETCILNFVLPVLLLQTLIACFAVAVTRIATDQAALLALKSQISDPLNLNWSTSASVCTWIGVTCGHHHRVTALNLSDMGLQGTIPSEIGKLSFLSLLSIRNNSFYGSLPNELTHLLRLQYLDFEHNLFNGSIPPSLGSLRRLKSLLLAANKLTGAIPPEIGNFTNLEILRIRDNDLTGNIPPAIFNISTIQAIVMSANNLTGNLPSTMGLFLPSLVELRLSGNELEGTIPRSISNASMLTFIDLSNNSFTGSIPRTLGNLRHLEVLNLANNNLTSESSTQESSFLTSLTNCKHLRKVDLSGISLGATLPVSIRNLSASLEQFGANNCNVRGSIPREIGNLTSLIALSLSNNQLTGTIPTTLGSLRKLQGLNLQGNRLEGEITYNLCYLDSLFDLSLGVNQLLGSIPECLGNLTTLRHLKLSSNNFTSTIPLSLWSLKGILVINLSSNFLSGTLPSTTERPDFITELDLSRNRLSGPIPRYLLGMSMEFLDLSCNNLSGEIPGDPRLQNLKYFNVSFNALVGEIPDFLNFSANSYMKNRGLCGAPKLKVPPCPPCPPHQQVPPCPPHQQVPPQGAPQATQSGFPRRSILLYLGLILPFVLVASSIFLLLKSLKMKASSRKSKITSLSTQAPRSFLYLELEQATDGFSGDNLVGIGSFGSVYKGTLQDGMVVAIKVFNMDEEWSLMSFDIECEIMQNTRHRNLVRFLRSYSYIDFKALVMEYMANGSLDKWLYTHSYHLDILQRLDIMIDAASAVKYLHCDYSRPIVHCDLKPSNILLDEDMIARVSDFSIANVIDPAHKDPTIQSHVKFTIGYVAPECGLYGIVSMKTDVYSFGIILMDTFTGKRPTDEMFSGEISLRTWVIESLPDGVNRVADPSLLHSDQEEHFAAKMVCLSSIMTLAQCCTAESPNERFNMVEVMHKLNKIKDSFVKDIS